MNPDLLRQRRNLIAISSVLLVFDFAQVTIAKVSVLGTELFVGNANILMICAWVMWAYFLLRYYQYWRAEPATHIRSSFKRRLDAYARAHTRTKAVQDAAGQVYDDYKIARTGAVTWLYTVQLYDPITGGMIDGPVSTLPRWRLAVWSLKSALFIAIQTPHASDHVLPFALGFAAPVVTLYTRL